MADRPQEQAAVMDQPVEKKGMSTADLARAADQARQKPAEQNVPAAERQKMDGHVSLLPENELVEFRTCWQSIQTGFVDEPKKSVEDADALVASLMKRLAETFSTERSQLEDQWNRGDNASTEELRLALRRYRSFFDRLLSV